MKKNLRIAILDRIDSKENPGGDTLQINEITRYLGTQGYSVTLFNDLYPDLNNFDLALIFNLTIYQETLFNVFACKRLKIPYILFTIYWNIDNLKIPIFDIKSLAKRLLNKNYMAAINNYKNIFLNQEFKTYNYLVKEHKTLFTSKNNAIEFMINNALYICPNSIAEKEHILQEFNRIKANRFKVIYNGIQKDMYKNIDINSKRKGIICVGGIGPRKNQLSLAKAAYRTKIDIDIIGKSNISNKRYLNKVKGYEEYVHLIGWKPYKEVKNIMLNSMMHFQPSFIETPGLASMEAYVLGCKVVVSNVPTVTEYFSGEDVIFINPYSIQSIEEALKLSKDIKPDIKLNKLKNFNEKFEWDTVLKELDKLL